MQTVSYKQCRDLWCDICEKDASQPDQLELEKFNRSFNRAMRRAWEWFWWPELLVAETRHFRDAWTATSFAAGAEVYHAAPDKYWRAATAAAAGDVPGVSAAWSEITQLDPYVAYDQTGKTALGTVKEVWTGDYRTDPNARQLSWEYDERGVYVTSRSVPTSVFLRFRQRCPQWRGSVYTATASVAAGLTRYYSSPTEGFEGDYYTALATAVANESPETAPAKWSKVRIPTWLSDFAVHAAKIAQLEGDGALEKALASTQGELWSWLYDERDKLSTQTTPRRARVANL